MNTAIILQPFVPIWLVAVMTAIGAGAALLSVQRSRTGSLLRVLGAGILAAFLLNPQIENKETTPLDDIAIILVDKSASQRLDGRDAVTREAADNLRAVLQTQSNVEIIESVLEGDDETNLGNALSQALSTTSRARLAGVFVVTDGRSHDQINHAALPAETPLHGFFTGRPDEYDRKISLLKSPRYGVVNSPVDISFRIDDLGPDDESVIAGQAFVTLKVNGEEITRQSVPIGTEIQFAAPLSRPGKTIIELETAAVPGELSDRNNIAILPISTIRDRLRVLLISGEPHAGERVWRNLLKSDPSIDLVHFTILRPAEKQAADGFIDQRELALIEFPQDELFIDKLSEFDLVIFDRYTYRGALNAYHFDNIARYVEDGGAVLVAAGPELNGTLSLAARRNFAYLLPAVPTGQSIQQPFRPSISKAGVRHPVTLNLPDTEYWGRWLRVTQTTPRSGRVLMTGPDDTPLLILDRVSEGRVGLLLSDHVWLWARGFDGGGPHGELLRRISHWLMKEPELEEERLILSNAGGDLLIERRTLDDDISPVSLTLPNGEEVDVTLSSSGVGQFTATLENAKRGLYRAKSDGLFAIGEIGLGAPPEFTDVVVDHRSLEQTITKSKGGVFDVRQGIGATIPEIRRVSANARQKSTDRWAGLARRNASRVEAIALAPLAPPFIWLFALGAAIVGAWWAEGRRR